MKNIFLYLLITTSILSCQSKPKEKIKEIQEPLHLAHEQEDREEKKPTTKPSENNCGYDNPTFSLGKGLVMANSDSGNNSSILEIYNDSLLQDKYINWSYYEEEPTKAVCPQYYKPDYGILHFVYLKETALSYQILNSYNEIKYLPKIKNHVKTTWEDYILSSYGVRRIDKEHDKAVLENPLRKLPFENSAKIIFPKGYEMFCPMEIKGDWVKIQYDCFYNQESNKYEGQPCHDFIDKCKPAQIGWIKWREKNKILIDIFLMP